MVLGQLGTELSLSPTSVTRLVDRLEERGLVERTRDEEDRRKVAAALLPRGKDVIAAVPLLEASDIRTAVEGLSEAERTRIAGALRDLVGAIGAVQREHEADSEEAQLLGAREPAAAR
jgi:DNA-binding MarR family transcriptional regulator